MKTIKYIMLSFILLLSFSSCNSWLDVQPKTEIKYDKMFENESGFKNAITGCYMMMTDKSLYGKELTVCMLDNFAHEYQLDATNGYMNAYNNDYETMSGSLDAIWEKT